jgi:hypothetical protein
LARLVTDTTIDMHKIMINDDQDQERLFEDVTEVRVPNEGSTKPKRSPKPNPKYSSDDYDLKYVGTKSRTRSRRSIRRAGQSSR